MSAELLLLRHGRTAWNAARRFQGQLDPPLDEVGIAQSEAVAPVVAALGPVALLTSDLQRAVATAAPLAAATGLTARVDPRLREIALGAWQGMTSDEAAVAFPAEHVAWVDGRDVRRGGGETYVEVAVRAVAAIDDAVHAVGDGLVVAVTHGGTARAAAGTLLALPRERWSVLGPLGNARLGLLRQAVGGGWRLLEWNSRGPELRL